jgi:hypothetical protein
LEISIHHDGISGDICDEQAVNYHLSVQLRGHHVVGKPMGVAMRILSHRDHRELWGILLASLYESFWLLILDLSKPSSYHSSGELPRWCCVNNMRDG